MYISGSFTNYVDKFLDFFDHLPYLINVEKATFLGYLTPFLSFWMNPYTKMIYLTCSWHQKTNSPILILNKN